MRRTGSVLAVVTALAVALGGCGKKEDEVVIADPLNEALAHAPADAAALAVVATDPAGGAGRGLAELGRRFPGFELVLAQGQTSLGDRLGLDWSREIEPLLGHPLVLWSPDGSPEQRFAAWVVRDPDRLGEALAEREMTAALVAEGDLAGYATFRRRGGGAYARRGPVLVSAPDLTSLRSVLRRRSAARGQWTPELLRARGLGLPTGSVARVELDAARLVARRGGTLEAVPWVAALRRVAVTVTPLGGGLRVHARASTAPLAAGDLPIAAGVEPPVTRGGAPVTAAVRAPRQTLDFVRRITDLLAPGRLDGVRQADEVLNRYARLDLDEDLLDRLTGTATLTSPDGRRLTLRADLDDPDRTVDALTRLGRLARFGGPLASLAGVDLEGFDVEERDGRYDLTQQGKLLVALQVVDGAIVASNDPAADLVAAGRAAPAPPAPTAGAFRATLGAELLRDQITRRLDLPAFARGLLAPLGAGVVTARAESELFDLQVVLPVAR